MDINYGKKVHYNTAKYPIRQPIYPTALINILSRIMLLCKQYKVEKNNMDGLNSAITCPLSTLSRLLPGQDCKGYTTW